ncbi:hypothetical protein GCM10025781_20840 [Kocuria gwangalliensis]|uniref:Integrase catalytic domain-containing protein n=1 Tax=Kocuria gwangalliensis TaxID=501592 RepID=A0ABP8X994_9MICC
MPGPDGTLRRTWLFHARLAWSRVRVVIPVWDQTTPSLIACLDATLRRIGGAPTHVLTDNPRTVTVGHVGGVRYGARRSSRWPGTTAPGSRTCVPYDPESKGGKVATVKTVKADLVPT